MRPPFPGSSRPVGPMSWSAPTRHRPRSPRTSKASVPQRFSPIRRTGRRRSPRQPDGGRHRRGARVRRARLAAPRTGLPAVADRAWTFGRQHHRTAGRVHLPTAVLAHRAQHDAGQRPAPDDPPALVFWPFGSVGVCQLLAGASADSGSCCWRSSPSTTGCVTVRSTGSVDPGATDDLRMILAADVPPTTGLAELPVRWRWSAGARAAGRVRNPLRYPAAVGLRRNEFAGTVCAWTPAAQFGVRPGTVRQPAPRVEVRIVDPDSHIEVPTGEHGLLSARVEILGRGG